jgi:hypothetical protein
MSNNNLNQTAPMRLLFFLLLSGIPLIGLSQDTDPKEKKELETEASFSFHSNGIAPIPAFSLDKPALAASLSVRKGRFSYDPAFFYSLEMKPWFLDNWLHYKIISRPGFELMAGANFSTFCSGFEINDQEILKAERYFAFSLTGTYFFSPLSSLAMDYWSDNGQEAGSLTGHFAAVTYKRSDIHLGKKVLLSCGLMLFYINYSGSNDGLFVSPTASLSVKAIPVSLFFQATQAIQSNIDPWPGFKWNVGVSYDL